ncbi:hypothetical protein HPB51_010161 [Rhipicephalus microplus]|uniref:Uncharacterized protein n=1 Tax=Rhipicephalus microplus TaxID=6941 RepID=A0A9J6F233_RHIMP|nr:hypothetical protein HPB51_010161 [Rhipicephalus microplus]
MRECHVENRPRTETADFTPRLPSFPTGHCHHPISSSRRAAADLRPSSAKPLPEDYYSPSRNVPVEHDPSPRTSDTSARANASRQVPVCNTWGLPGHISRFRPSRPPAPPRFSTYPARIHEIWTSHRADHRPRELWPMGRSTRFPHSRKARAGSPAALKQRVKKRRQLAYLSPACVLQGCRRVRFRLCGKRVRLCGKRVERP